MAGQGEACSTFLLNCVIIPKITPPASKDELEAFYRVLSKTGKLAILSIIPGYSKVMPPPPLNFKSNCLGMQNPDLLTECEAVFSL